MISSRPHAPSASRHRRSGFTLLEILIVLAIIGVIAAMAVPRLLANQKAALIKVTKSSIKSLEQAAELYAVDNGGELPTDPNQLLMKNEETGAPAQLDKLPEDAWKQTLFYEYPNTKADTEKAAIWSSGPNRQNENGGGDDINNWSDLTK